MNMDRDVEGGGGPNHLISLNSDNSLNLHNKLTYNVEPDDFNPYTELCVDSLFHDLLSIISKFSNTCVPSSLILTYKALTVNMNNSTILSSL